MYSETKKGKYTQDYIIFTSDNGNSIFHHCLTQNFHLTGASAQIWL